MNVKKIIEKMLNQPNGIRSEEATKVLEFLNNNLYNFKR